MMMPSRRHVLAMMFGGLLLSGCAAQPWQLGEEARLHGEVYYLERIALPRDSVVHVALVELNDEGQADRALIEVDILPGHQPPIPFTLNAPTQVLQHPARYGIYGEIRDRDGSKRWVTPVPVAISDERISVRVQPLQTATD